jgi:hypothetical protein
MAVDVMCDDEAVEAGTRPAGGDACTDRTGRDGPSDHAATRSAADDRAWRTSRRRHQAARSHHKALRPDGSIGNGVMRSRRSAAGGGMTEEPAAQATGMTMGINLAAARTNNG